MLSNTKNSLRALTPLEAKRSAASRGDECPLISDHAGLSAAREPLTGFTLIEVMVVIAIVSILTGVVIASLGKGRVQRELQTNRDQVMTVIREAQNNALTGKRPSDRTPCSFSVEWGGTVYSLKYTYKDGNDNCTSSPTTIFSYALKNGVQFGNSGSVSFSVPHARPSFGSGSISILFMKSGTYDTGCVYANGRTLGYPGNAACGQ